jgi:hypothetical protein
MIVVEGYAESQSIINQLNKKYPIYLKSKHEKIKLEVKEILVGEFYLTQVILFPEKKLTVGDEYALCIEGISAHKKPFQRWNTKTRSYENIKWQVVAGRDEQAPVWREKPKNFTKSLTHLGCGPAMYVVFDFQVEESSEYLIKTTVLNKKTQKSTSYYLKHNNGKIQIGHGMCSGAFVFNDDDYEVTFDLVDVAGNITRWDEQAISFTKPTDADSEE